MVRMCVLEEAFSYLRGEISFLCVTLLCLIVSKTFIVLSSIGANLQDVFEETWNPFKPSRDTGPDRGEEARFFGHHTISEI